ncbi:hypothetical protein ACOSP7_004802 [Xanthoceras sorbifolium]
MALRGQRSRGSSIEKKNKEAAGSPKEQMFEQNNTSCIPPHVTPSHNLVFPPVSSSNEQVFEQNTTSCVPPYVGIRYGNFGSNPKSNVLSLPSHATMSLSAVHEKVEHGNLEAEK